MEIISSYRREGRIEGKKEGKLEGKLEGKRDSICTFLEAKFSSASTSLQEEILSIKELQTLDHILEKIFSAETFDEAKDVVDSVLKNH